MIRKLLAVSAVFALALVSVPVHASDLSITAASFQPGANAKYLSAVAGATITVGQPLYLDAGDSNRAKPADSDASSAAAGLVAATAKVVGLAAHGALAGQPVVYIYEDDDLTLGATLSMSAPIYVLSDTAGGIAPSADIDAADYPVVLLIAKSTTKCILRPRVLQGVAAAVAP